MRKIKPMKIKRRRKFVEYDNHFVKYGILLFGIVLIILVAINSNGRFVDKAIKCNKLKGYYCTNYDIDKMESE